MAKRNGKVFVVALLAVGASLLGGGLVGFRAWLAHRPHSSGVRAVAISPDGTLVATASDDHTVKLWDAAGLGREPAERASATLFGHRKEVRSVAFDEGGRLVSSEAQSGTAIAWDVENRRPLTARGGASGCPDTIVAVTSSLRAIGARDGSVELLPSWRASGSMVWHAHPGPITGIAFLPARRLLLSSGWDDEAKLGAAKLWNLEGSLDRVLLGPDVHVVGVGFSRDGSAVTVTHDGLLQVWHLPDGHESAQVALTPEAGHPTCMAASPDGRWVAIGCARAGDPAAHVLESGTVLRIDLP